MRSMDNPAVRAENVRSLRRRGFSEADAVRQAVSPSAGSPPPKSEISDGDGEIPPAVESGDIGAAGPLLRGPAIPPAPLPGGAGPLVDQSAGLMKPGSAMMPAPPPSPAMQMGGIIPGQMGAASGPAVMPGPVGQGPSDMEQALIRRALRPAVQPTRAILR